MEININKVFDLLLGKQVVNLSKLALVNRDKSWEILTDTFVFALSNLMANIFKHWLTKEKLFLEKLIQTKKSMW